MVNKLLPDRFLIRWKVGVAATQRGHKPYFLNCPFDLHWPRQFEFLLAPEHRPIEVALPLIRAR
jgi:hypothetical protein